MAQVEFKSKALRSYVQRVLGKQESDIITEEDLRSIKSLSLDKNIFKDLVMGELVFLSGISSLSLNNIDINPDIVNILNSLKGLKTLSISNARVNIEQLKCMNLESLILVNCEGIDIKQFKNSLNIKNFTMINCKNANLKGISNFQNLDSVNLANNEWMKDEDIEDLWNSQSVKKVNLDGSTNIKDVDHDGMEISNNEKYRPGEISDWSTPERRPVYINNLSSMSKEDLENLRGENITISGADLDFLRTPEGKEMLATIGSKNSFNLVVENTAQINMQDMEELSKVCRMNRVHVQTGWPVTQDRGYSFETFKAIKGEISNYVDDIKNDPNLTEEQKYIKVRQRITQSISYNYAALGANPGDREYYTSRNLEDGLLNHTCVCAGYSDIMKNVLAELGIESKYVEGKTDTGELHAWNQVRLKGDDGKYHWYNDDVTWDAVSQSAGKNEFEYCLMNDNEFSRTHSCIPGRTEGYGVYACDSQPPLAARVAKNSRTQDNSIYMQQER